uniref:Putative secreted protein n=1 Tax=Amblyomma americanum TaxID=6943 RepID=A0A0C9R5D2_AMBAM
MRGLSCLTLLAFLAGTLVLVAATRGRREKQVRVKTPDPDEFVGDGDECRPKNNGNCSYRLACDCEPPPGGFIRGERYFFSPDYQRCVRSAAPLSDGCNSFETFDECWNNCARRRPKVKHQIRRKKRLRVEHHWLPYHCNLLQ